jgi:serine/threonine-protein phosphatase 2B catalytic subunit
MLLAILSTCSAEELETSSEESTDVSDKEEDKLGDFPMSPEISARRQQIKNKILAVGRLQRVFNVLRYVCPGHHLIISLIHLCPRRREEAEGASELTHLQNPPVPGSSGTLGVRLGPDALGVHGNQWIRSFDEAYVHFLIQFPHHRFH